MNINAIGGAFYPYQKTSPPALQQQGAAAYTIKNSVQDSISLSASAQQTLAVSETSSLEAHAIPSWRADYGYVLSGKLGASANTLGESDEPGTPGAELTKVPKHLRSEFGAVVHRIYQQVLHENGIDTQEKHYQSLIVDKEQSESLHQQYLEKLNVSADLAQIFSAARTA